MPVGRSLRKAVASAAAAAPVLAGLPVEPLRCGDHTCGPHQYCSKSRNTCDDCAQICDRENRNYVSVTCQSDCQVYLLDMRYKTRHDDVNVASAMGRLEGDLHRLTIMVSVMFCLFIVCFLGLAVYACSGYRKACRRRKTADIEKNSLELKKIGAKPPNGITRPPPTAAPPVISPKPTGNPLYTVGGRLSLNLSPKEDEKRVRSRHPSEDTCPGEYSAVYDNLGMVVTPPAAAAAAGGRPLSVGGSSLQSRDSFRPAGPLASGGRPEVPRRPREVDITDMSPATTVEAI